MAKTLKEWENTVKATEEILRKQKEEMRKAAEKERVKKLELDFDAARKYILQMHDDLQAIKYGNAGEPGPTAWGEFSKKYPDTAEAVEKIVEAQRR